MLAPGTRWPRRQASGGPDRVSEPLAVTTLVLVGVGPVAGPPRCPGMIAFAG
jgi:hypothetical protein